MWKRARRSVKLQRDEAAFRHSQSVLTMLTEYEKKDQLTLVYFDESGFCTVPTVPYAWQPVGETLCIPSKPSKRLNVLGFISRTFPGLFHQHIGRVNTEVVIETFNDFADRYYKDSYKQTKRPCIIVLDNASMHRSHAFQEKIDDWMACGIMLYYLPPYSPELNLIEIVWRRVKYQWLPVSAYCSFDALRESVTQILNEYGEKYSITFA